MSGGPFAVTLAMMKSKGSKGKEKLANADAPRFVRLAHGVTLAPTDHPRYSWVVHYPAPGGRRARKHFRSDSEARGWAKELAKEVGAMGAQFAPLSDLERAAVARWRKVADDAGKVRVPSLLEVVELAEAKLRGGKLGVTVEAAVEQFLADRRTAGASPRHLRSLDGRLGRFVRDFGGQSVAAIEAPAVADWLAGLELTRGGGKVAHVTRDNFRRCLLGLFNFSVRREWIDRNPVPALPRSKTKRERLARAGAAAILAPAEVRRFMEALAALRTIKGGSAQAGNVTYHEHDHLSWWALKVFAGLRDAEAAAIGWEAIDLARGEITVPAEISKTGDRRTVRIEPVLEAWLQLRPADRRRGPVAPRSEMTRRYALRLVLRKLRTGPDGEPEAFDLPANWARHSFASYHLYAFRNPGETALQLGHKGNPAMLHGHYKNPSAERDAAEFWKIWPPGHEASTKVIEGSFGGAVESRAPDAAGAGC